MFPQHVVAGLHCAVATTFGSDADAIRYQCDGDTDCNVGLSADELGDQPGTAIACAAFDASLAEPRPQLVPLV